MVCKKICSFFVFVFFLWLKIFPYVVVVALCFFFAFHFLFGIWNCIQHHIKIKIKKFKNNNKKKFFKKIKTTTRNPDSLFTMNLIDVLQFIGSLSLFKILSFPQFLPLSSPSLSPLMIFKRFCVFYKNISHTKTTKKKYCTNSCIK